MPKKAGSTREDKQAATAGDRQDDASSAGVGEPGVDQRRPGGDLQDLRRAWGHLPMREREEIIQGVGERYLERYRDWIERYYRTLQETDD
jgi:hypothetical protein